MFSGIKPISRAAEPRDAFTRFANGLDLETPSWSVLAGWIRNAMNYELAVEDGYRDIKGYERFDGRASPSSASFTILDVTVTGVVAVGNTVTGAITGATGVVIAMDAYPDVPAQRYLVLTKVTGTFLNGAENLLVAAVNQANTDAVGYADSAPTSKLKAQYKNLAADVYRADIAAVPGEGVVWGGFSLGADKYAIRNKVGGATAGLYKATAAGWAAVTLNREVAFTSGGVHQIVPGEVITGATSAATATVKRVQKMTGTWAGGDAAGWLTLSGQVGNFVAENLNIPAHADSATIAANSAVMTLAPNGRLDFDISNFADTQGPDRMYGADGVNLAYEFDGTTFAKIRTGMVDDTPDHVAVHKNQLFLSFDGSSQNSGVGDPFAWTVVLGAAEIATGSPITGYQVQPGSAGDAALLIACRQQLFVLYGNDPSDFNLVRYRERVGAYEWTIQEVAYTLFLDDRGITDLRTSQAFGNFDHSSLSNRIRSYLNTKRTLATASCVVRDKNQYRLFFTDKTAIYATMDGEKLKGMMPITLGHKITTIWSLEDVNGNEEVFFGSDDGFLYQMERGTSFDGANIYAFLQTHFDHGKSIQWEKTYVGPVTIEGRGSGYAEFDLAYELSYGSSLTTQPNAQTAVMPAAETAMWDTGIAWDTGLSFDQTALVPAVGLDLRGDGQNIAWTVVKDSDYFEPLLLSGVHYRYVRRVQIRG